jgi:hypothetical protein
MDPNAASVVHWMAEVATFHAELLQRYQPSMRQRIDMNLLWRRALREAHAKLIAYRQDERAVVLERVRGRLVETCPMRADELCDEDFDIRVAVEPLRDRFSPEPLA